MIIPGFYKIDKYIIRKFLGTFFFAILMLIFITVVFDLSERISSEVVDKVREKTNSFLFRQAYCL